MWGCFWNDVRNTNETLSIFPKGNVAHWTTSIPKPFIMEHNENRDEGALETFHTNDYPATISGKKSEVVRFKNEHGLWCWSSQRDLSIAHSIASHLQVIANISGDETEVLIL